MNELNGRRVLLTQADEYMGPAIAERFTAAGAELVESRGALVQPAQVEELLEHAGAIDVLVANLAWPSPPSAVEAIDDGAWLALFDVLVHPLMRLVRGVAGSMKARGGGHIVAITSAAPLRGIRKSAPYCAARGAQNAFIRAAGIELAPDGVIVNAIAQNWVRNPTYFPDGIDSDEKFQAMVRRNVPTGRLAEAEETAALALYLASDANRSMVGQVIPFAGGWVTTTG